VRTDRLSCQTPPFDPTCGPHLLSGPAPDLRVASALAKNLFVAYDLFMPGHNQLKVEAIIRSFGTHSKVLSNAWYVKTGLAPSAVRDRIQAVLTEHDKLLVLDAKQAASHNLNQSAWAGVMEKWNALFP
jgi:hypothetical protein